MVYKVEPWKYELVCLISDGRDTDPPTTQGRCPTVEKGENDSEDHCLKPGVAKRSNSRS